VSDLTNHNKDIPSDQGSHETAALYVPANRLAKVDVIDVFTPLANRVMPRDQALAPTALHNKDSTLRMGGPESRAASASGTIATSVLQRLHGSNSDELFGAALRSKQDSLINSEIPRFSLVGKLGEGSQGIVYRVNDRDCHREVACKVLSYATTDPEEISRFIHEAQVTAQLEHPGIVPIHDLGELRDGTVYYTMKRVDGVSMQDLLTTRSGKPEHRFELLEMFLRICETMAFAHSRGVIHRDLKPRNIMAGPFGEVLVLDWGLAKVVNCIDVARPMASMRSFPEADAYRTLNGTAVGTPAYMSPEQAMGEVDTLDRRCDIYSLGVILYEILAGASPYVRGEARKVMHQVSHGMWTRLDARKTSERLPPALMAIVHRAMAFERTDRYQTVELLTADLRAFIAGGAVSVYHETTIEKYLRLLSLHQRQVRTALIVAGLAACLGLGIWGNQWYENERVIADLHAKLEERLASNQYVEARDVSERILALRPDDRRVLRQSPQITEGIERLEKARVQADKRKKADELMVDAKKLAAVNDEASLKTSGELYMQALGLVGEDPAILNAYADGLHQLTSLETKKADAKKLAAARRSLDSAERDLHWARPKRKELADMIKEARRLEAASQKDNDPTLRSRLHTLEGDIGTLRTDLAAHEGRAADSFDMAVSYAPTDAVVRQALAAYYMELLLDCEARGDLTGIVKNESRIRMYDDQRQYDNVLSGQSWIKATKGQHLTIQALVETSDRTLEPEALVQAIPFEQELTLLQGRYLVRNALGTVKAIQLRRGKHQVLDLPAPPNLPESVAFIPAGTVIDRDGDPSLEIPAFALARREVSCGEWLRFLNDPTNHSLCAEAEARGGVIFVPQKNNIPLWPKDTEGNYRLPHAADGSAVDPSWPICHITGRDALAYAKWRSRQDNLEWRLPTHGEWMLAAQGGDGRPYPWGLRADIGFSASALGATQDKWCAHPVGSHPKDRSVQGVFDLGGSVAEMVFVEGFVRLAAGGSHRDRQPEVFGVSSTRDVIDDQPDPGVGLRLALTVPPTAQ
jgi:serine/threonine protein kinase